MAHAEFDGAARPLRLITLPGRRSTVVLGADQMDRNATGDMARTDAAFATFLRFLQPQ